MTRSNQCAPSCAIWSVWLNTFALSIRMVTLVFQTHHPELLHGLPLHIGAFRRGHQGHLLHTDAGSGDTITRVPSTGSLCGSGGS